MGEGVPRSPPPASSLCLFLCDDNGTVVEGALFDLRASPSICGIDDRVVENRMAGDERGGETVVGVHVDILRLLKGRRETGRRVGVPRGP